MSSWSSIVSWYSDCQRPARPMLSGLGWVRKCMWVVLNQTKNGVSASCWRLMKSTAASRNSSSQVSIRFLVSGPVSSMRWVPSAFAHVCRTPRGPNFLRNSGSFGIVGELGLLLGVEVVQVAEELVEAVHRRQVLVAVAEVVLAELAGGVALRLQRRRDGRILGCSPSVAPGRPTLVRPVRYGFWPVMNAARPAVQLCSP